MPNLSVKLGRVNLKSPVIIASGTFSEELLDFLNAKDLGAITTKTITLKPYSGNPPKRTCETPCGLLNSIGLENPGLEVFLKKNLPYFLKLKVPLIVSISSLKKPQELVVLTRELDKIKDIFAIELNISCPNLRKRYLISQDSKATYQVVKKVRYATQKPLIVKLSPNVTDITLIAKAAIKAGAEIISLINTLMGMCVDIENRRPRLSNLTGGLSGPAIKPVALRMVWEVYRCLKVPVIGMGGIIEAQDAIEFLLCGASAIGIGTANFINPKVSSEILAGIKEYLVKNKINDINNLIGGLKDET